MQCVVKRAHSGLARPMESSAHNSTMAQQSMQIGTIGTPGHTNNWLYGLITCVLRVYRSRVHTDRRVPQTFRCLCDGDVTMLTLHASCHLIVYCSYRTVLQILTGRPSVLWHQGTQKINLTDFCEDAVDDSESIADLCAEWPAHVASEALELGLSCVAPGRRGVKQRPTVEKCIATVSGMMELPMLPLPAAQKECVVCLDAARGRHRFMPCECIPSLA